MNFSEFEREYLSIRTKEGRVYDDDVVMELPFIDHPEWKIRARSAKKLLHQLEKENCRSITEIGCGNGWLTNYLQRELNVPAFGIDINKKELDQAKRTAMGNSNYFYGDIFSDEFKNLRSGTIILAASIQYFPDPIRLINSLSGTIHIIDSPFYEDATEARLRSQKYFDSKDAPGMKRFYFHHEFNQLKDAEFLYRPSKLKRLFGGSPFPWIRIRKGPSAF